MAVDKDTLVWKVPDCALRCHACAAEASNVSDHCSILICRAEWLDESAILQIRLHILEATIFSKAEKDPQQGLWKRVTRINFFTRACATVCAMHVAELCAAAEKFCAVFPERPWRLRAGMHMSLGSRHLF